MPKGWIPMYLHILTNRGLKLYNKISGPNHLSAKKHTHKYKEQFTATLQNFEVSYMYSSEQKPQPHTPKQKQKNPKDPNKRKKAPKLSLQKSRNLKTMHYIKIHLLILSKVSSSLNSFAKLNISSLVTRPPVRT